MSQTPEADPRLFARVYRILSTAMTSAAVLVGLVGTIAIARINRPVDRPWLVAVPFLLALALHLLAERIGYRVRALEPTSLPPARTRSSQMAWQSTAILRLAITESLGIIGLAFAFVLSHGQLVMLWTSVALSLGLMLFHGQPWRRPVLKVTAGLEAGGATSSLPEMFGVARTEHPHGVVKEL